MTSGNTIDSAAFALRSGAELPQGADSPKLQASMVRKTAGSNKRPSAALGKHEPHSQPSGGFRWGGGWRVVSPMPTPSHGALSHTTLSRGLVSHDADPPSHEALSHTILPERLQGTRGNSCPTPLGPWKRLHLAPIEEQHRLLRGSGAAQDLRPQAPSCGVI